MTLASSTVKDFLNGKNTEITEKSRSPPRTWSKTTQPAAIAHLRDGDSIVVAGAAATLPAAPPAHAASSPEDQQAIDAAFDASQLTLRDDAARQAAAEAHDAEQLRLGLALSASQTIPQHIIDATRSCR